ncbi:MAG: InlB B-repeat-containing protein [Bacteroidales bacterium]|nr:InlB B-repeat-containing protein [Bacteroidales bacterium]
MRKFFVFFAIISVAGMLAFSGCNFETITYTVSFNANGGEDSMSPQIFTDGVEQALSSNTFTRDGYSFTGWNTMRDSSGTAYTDKQRIKVVSDMTLYAQWIADSILHPIDTTGNTFVVTFDANGGTGTMQPQTFTKDVPQALAMNAFTRENYSFYCWDTVPDGAGLYLDGQEITVTSDMTLYAKWTEDTPGPVTIVVTFNANGGTGTMQPQTFQSGVRQELTANAFTREGYSFVKWNTVADGSGLHYYDEQDIVIYESMTLYAQWSSNGGTQGEGQLNGHAYIDLGLPSGTKWATCNVGTTVPEGYGEPVAWGETASKYSYFWTNYEYCNGSYVELTKYCNVSYYGINGHVDNLTTLESVDDAATTNWGAGWRTPTRNEMDELFDNCTRTAVTQGGVAGYKFTGPNGNSIFLPANGYRDMETVYETNTCYYWTSTLYTANEPYMAYSLIVGPENSYVNVSSRARGLLVRAVCSPANN